MSEPREPAPPSAAIDAEVERRVRRMADAIPHLAWISAPNGDVEYVNARWFSYTGQSPTRIGTSEWLEVTHPADRARVLEAHHRSIESGSDFEVEYRLRHRSGAYRWHIARTAVLPDEEGRPQKRFGTATDIDDQRTALTRYEAALAGMTDGFVLFDRAWRYQFANEEWLRFVRLPLEEVLGRSIWEVAPRMVGTPFHAALVRSMESGQSARFECYSATLERWLEIRAYPTSDGLSVFSSSIHEAKLAREAIENQEKWLEAALDLVPVPMSFIEPGTGRVLFANRAADRMAGGALPKGIPLSEYPPTYRVTDGNDAPIAPDRTFSARVARGETFDGEEFVWHTPAGRFPVLVAGDTLPEMHGHPPTCITVFQDITRLKDYERTLKASESRFRALFEQSPVSLQIFDRGGDCTLVNPAWERHFATSRRELDGFNLFRDRQLAESGLLALIERAYAGESIRTPTHRFDPAASGRVGRAVWQDVYLFPARDASGEVAEIAIIALDVTEQQETLARLEQAIRARDEFLSSASHELRTPLTSMLLRLGLARRGLDRGDARFTSSDALRPLFGQLEESLVGLSRLVEDLLDITRARSGTFAVDLREDDLAKAVRDMVDRLRAQIAEAGMDLTLQLPPSLPVRFDALRLEQVLTNLVTNAIRYAPGTSLAIRLEATDGGARLTVQDGGPGIPPSAHDRIFERFERGAAPAGVSGLGLGLFIVREIVGAHGGTTRVESDVGRGATFIVELPRA